MLSPAVLASHAKVNPGLFCLILLLSSVSLITFAPSYLSGCSFLRAQILQLVWYTKSLKSRAEQLKLPTQQQCWTCLIHELLLRATSCSSCSYLNLLWNFCVIIVKFDGWTTKLAGGCFFLSIQFLLCKKLKTEPPLPSVTLLAIPLLDSALCYFSHPFFGWPQQLLLSYLLIPWCWEVATCEEWHCWAKPDSENYLNW